MDCVALVEDVDTREACVRAGSSGNSVYFLSCCFEPKIAVKIISIF